MSHRLSVAIKTNYRVFILKLIAIRSNCSLTITRTADNAMEHFKGAAAVRLADLRVKRLAKNAYTKVWHFLSISSQYGSLLMPGDIWRFRSVHSRKKADSICVTSRFWSENTIIDLWMLFYAWVGFYCVGSGTANTFPSEQRSSGGSSTLDLIADAANAAPTSQRFSKFNKFSDRFFIAINWYAESRNARKNPRTHLISSPRCSLECCSWKSILRHFKRAKINTKNN